MENFVAIDVETANFEPTSVCSIGAVKVKNGVIVDQLYRLVKPEPEYYLRRFTTQIHGIGKADTENEPVFSEVWAEFDEFIEGLPLVAHNKKFDQKCIEACLRCYRMDHLYYRFYCTLEASRRKIPRSVCGSYSLPAVCNFLGIPFFNHHDALADARAAAQIAMVLL